MTEAGKIPIEEGWIARQTSSWVALRAAQRFFERHAKGHVDRVDARVQVLTECIPVARRIERALGDDDGRAFRQEHVRARRRFTSRKRPGGFGGLGSVASERVVNIVEIDDGEDILIKKKEGQPDFALELKLNEAIQAC